MLWPLAVTRLMSMAPTATPSEAPPLLPARDQRRRLHRPSS